MKNIKLLIVFVVLILIAGLIYFSNQKGTLNLRNSSFAIENIGEITDVKITSKNDLLSLQKISGQWKVNDKYLANDWAINNFMLAINRLDVISPVSKAEKGQIASILKSDGIYVEILKGRRVLRKYYVSKPSMSKDHTYMMMYKSKEPFAIGIPLFKGHVSDLFIADENYWRDKTIFKYKPQDIKSILVEYPGDEQKSFQLINFNDGTFALKNLKDDNFVKEFDVEKAIRYFNYYQRIAFEDLVKDLKPEQVDSVIQSEPYCIIEVEDLQGGKNKLAIFRKPSEDKLDEFGEKAKFDYNRAYASFNEVKELILIQYYIFDPLFKEIDYFR